MSTQCESSTASCARVSVRDVLQFSTSRPTPGMPISLIGSYPIPMDRTKIYICKPVKLQTSPPSFTAISKPFELPTSSPSERSWNVTTMPLTACCAASTLAHVTGGHSRHELALTVAMPQPCGFSSARLEHLHLIASGHTRVS